jgi:hypothetical protein
VREALAGLRFGGDPGDPEVDAGWGEPGLTPAERVIAWNTLEVLALEAGNPRAPVNAIPPRAVAHLHLRFVVGTEVGRLREAVQQHLAAHGFGDIDVSEPELMAATRLDPRDPWVDFVAASVQHSTGQAPVRLPNLGGSLPNEVFADILGLPTVWLPHSYAACNQHAPNEHLLAPVAREALGLMAGLWWDLGEGRTPGFRSTATGGAPSGGGEDAQRPQPGGPASPDPGVPVRAEPPRGVARTRSARSLGALVQSALCTLTSAAPKASEQAGRPGLPQPADGVPLDSTACSRERPSGSSSVFMNGPALALARIDRSRGASVTITSSVSVPAGPADATSQPGPGSVSVWPAFTAEFSASAFG